MSKLRFVEKSDFETSPSPVALELQRQAAEYGDALREPGPSALEEGARGDPLADARRGHHARARGGPQSWAKRREVYRFDGCSDV